MRTAIFASATVFVALSSAADAQIVYSGPVNLTVPNTFIGLYVNVVDGSSYTGPNTFPSVGGPGGNYDISIYGTTTYTFFSPGSSGLTPPTPVPADQKGYVSTGSTTGPVAPLVPNTIIGPGSTFNTGLPSGTAIATGTDQIFGFRFRNETDGLNTTHFGWARVNLTNGQPGLLLDYAFEATPLAPIAAGVIPEPATMTALFATAGLLLRRRRG